MGRLRFWFIFLLLPIFLVRAGATEATRGMIEVHQQILIQPGDTWNALSWRYGVDKHELRSQNPHINPSRNPSIGKAINLPAGIDGERPGVLIRGGSNVLEMAAANGLSPWTVALANDYPNPYYPVLERLTFLPIGDRPPREFPAGFSSLEVSMVPAAPGTALALRAEVHDSQVSGISLAGQQFIVHQEGNHLIALAGTGAFFPVGDSELVIKVDQAPLWSQPWLLAERDWTFEQITYTGTAASISPAEIQAERERLMSLWSHVTPEPLWNTQFRLPINDYLEISSHYGARRSYNGGPYRTYHEGVDFSAYGGTSVMAPAGGVVALAENLVARGGAVIIDHGLGTYTGLYHLSEILVREGEEVVPGQIVGQVGSTGLSTGNHLHWDLVIGNIWVDGAHWLSTDLGCWTLSALGSSCQPLNE